jgi:hypothetical protein
MVLAQRPRQCFYRIMTALQRDLPTGLLYSMRRDTQVLSGKLGIA